MNEKWNDVRTFAVIDLETSNLPDYHFNKCSITELSVYGFAASELRLQQHDGIQSPPSAPRVLHKLTLMINPMRAIDLTTESITGLNNEMLENEATFNVNAATTLISFLNHLQQPVCLVAHNGDKFDFPIVKSVLEKVKMRLSSEVICVDSLNAFRDIDEGRKCSPTVVTAKETEEVKTNDDVIELSDTADGCRTLTNVNEIVKHCTEMATHIRTVEHDDALDRNGKTDWRTLNETTPTRPTDHSKPIATNKLAKRKLCMSLADETTPTSTDSDIKENHITPLKSRRMLFGDGEPVARKKWKRINNRYFRGYKLINVYERVFGMPAKEAHRAEGDVNMLMQLMLHYGSDFRSYAEQWAIPFDEVKPLGYRT